MCKGFAGRACIGWLLAAALVYSSAAAPQYTSPLDAMLNLPDATVLKGWYKNIFFSDLLRKDKRFNTIYNMATNPTAQATYFWPEDAAWDSLSQQLCMPVPRIQDVMASLADIAYKYMSLVIVPNQTVMSDQFRNGRKLPSLDPSFSLPLTLQKTASGKDKWVFKGLAFNRSDVTIIRENITAGGSVIHFINTAIVNDEQRTFWTVQSKGECSKKPASSSSLPTPGVIAATASSPGPLPPGIIAAIAVVCAVAAAALIAAGLLFERKRRNYRSKSLEAGARQPGPSQFSSGPTASSGGERRVEQQNRPAYITDSASSVQGQTALMDAAEDSEDQDQLLLPAFEPNPLVPYERLKQWLVQDARRSSSSSSGAESAGEGASTSSSGTVLRFSEQLRRELDPQTGNPNIKNNYTNLIEKSLHSNTAVYFADGLHNPRQYAVKFYADPQACAAERDAYRELQGGQNRYIPMLEVAYVEPPGSPFTSFCAFERGSYSLDAIAQQPTTYYKLIDIFHQLLNAVQYLHDHGRVHRDMKPQNIVYFPERSGGTWLVIDLATSVRIGEEAKIVYTRDYCSPEVARAIADGQMTAVTPPAADMWGVGVIIYELVTGQKFFPDSWSEDGRMWKALLQYERLPSELRDITQLPGVDPSFRGVMRQVKRLLHRDPNQRPTPRQLLSDRLFQARNTTTQISQGSNISHGSGSHGSGALSASVSGNP